jgi:hypothetical protein
MDTYLLALGWWNLAGCVFMLCLFNQSLGHKLLVEWTGIFTEPYQVTYYSKLWLFWAIGLNVFFGLMNVMAAKWYYLEVQRFVVAADVVSYVLFVALGIWGLQSKKCGNGMYIGFAIFIAWAAWGYLVSC